MLLSPRETQRALLFIARQLQQDLRVVADALPAQLESLVHPLELDLQYELNAKNEFLNLSLRFHSFRASFNLKPTI